MQEDIFKTNNFHLIRLLAALQVLLHHSFTHLQVDGSFISSIAFFFPGVPVFFFTSGFLISRSYENNSRIKEYTQNRALRIFPALVVCALFTIISVAFTGYFSTIEVGFSDIVIWLASQVSFLQFYNPDFMRAYGVGAINGSLWTISVELQFYILIPIVYGFFGLAGENKKRNNIVIIALILFFILINRLYAASFAEHGEEIIHKLWKQSFSPWFYMFLIGVLFQKNFEFLSRLLADRIFVMLIIFVPIVYGLKLFFGLRMGNQVNPVSFTLLALFIFSMAYSYRGLSKRLLGDNDISYGVYIYHMPLVNMLIYLGLTASMGYLLLEVFATFIIAVFSWRVVERRCLQLKKHPLNPLR